MKELCSYIKKEGNLMWLIRIFFFFVVLGADLLVFVDPDMNAPIRILISAMFTYSACLLKYDSITQVNDWGKKQVIAEGLLCLPISRKMLLKMHYQELLKTVVGDFVLWCVMHFIFVREMEWIELIWLLLIVGIPGLVLVMKEGFILFHIEKN